MANRVVVLLSDEEFADVKGRAGLVPLSAWFRSLAFPNRVRFEDIEATREAVKAANLTRRLSHEEVSQARAQMDSTKERVLIDGDPNVQGPSYLAVKESSGSVNRPPSAANSVRQGAMAEWRAGRKPLVKPGEGKK